MVETTDNGNNREQQKSNGRKRKGSDSQHPEWMVSWKAAEHCDMTDKQWASYRSKGGLPPYLADYRPYRHRRIDLDAWMQLRQRGLWADWKELVHRVGDSAAWAVMLRRLKDAQDADQRLAAEVA